jgi:RimJ/RimL family protein N-acetyltransferase
VSQSATDKAIKKAPAAPARAFAVGWNDVQVRPFAERDVDPLLDFYYRSVRDAPAIQDFDFDRFPKESVMRQQLFGLLNTPSIVTVEHLGRPVGVHQLLDMKDGQAEFWAVLWNAEVRGKGIGAVSWYKACQYFFDSFPGLHVLLFKAPKSNPFSERLAKKLPLKFINEEELASPLYKAGIRANVYSVTRSEFERLHNEDELDE